MDRRRFMMATAAAGAALALPGCSGVTTPLASDVFAPPSENEHLWAGLAASLPEEHDYEARIEGRLPESIRGTLYRNGPGLFDRAGVRKRMILDGDGMIQQFRFAGGRVHYRNRFVRTAKFVAEEKAGRFLYPTWATPIPGGPTKNTGISTPGSASVTVVKVGDSLYAFDEGKQPWEMDPVTLETRGESLLGLPPGTATYQAHWKLDGVNGDWLHFGVAFGFNTVLHVTVFDRNGKLKRHFTMNLPRRCYLHDWAVSGKHLFVILHPAVMPMDRILSAAMGYGTLSGMIRWKPEMGNLVLVLDREGKEEPLYLETEANFVWHCANAHESGNETVVDFIGSDEIMGLGSSDTPFYTMMENREPGPDYTEPGVALVRYVIDPNKKTLRRETVADEDLYEMPFVNQQHVCHDYRYCYVARDGVSDRFWSSIARIDTKTGAVEKFEFGEGQYCSEPVFVAEPNRIYDAKSKDEPGWLLTECYCGTRKVCYLSVLRADDVAAGPVAKIWLRHHAPISLHGFWAPGA